MAYARDGQWEQSEKASAARSSSTPAARSRTVFARNLLLPLGRIEEALHQLRVAEKADPLSPEVHLRLAYVLTSAGRYDEAAGHCQKLPADDPNKSECLGRARLGQGRTGEAIQILATAPNPGYLGYAYGRAGRREEAEKLGSRCFAEPVPTNPHLCRAWATRTALWKLWNAWLRLALCGWAGSSPIRNLPWFVAIRGEGSSQEGRLAGVAAFAIRACFRIRITRAAAGIMAGFGFSLVPVEPKHANC